MEIGLARGKKLYDKRADIAKKMIRQRGTKRFQNSQFWVDSNGKGGIMKWYQ